VTTTAAPAFGAANATSSGMCGITLMNDQVGEVIADVMKTKAGVKVTYLPSMIRLDAVQRMDFVYDELSEALGEEPGFFGANVLEESMSTHYGRMVHEDDRTIMFANPEDAAEYLGFDLPASVTADVPSSGRPAD
jgi:propane monooxygenase coupling protein